ncbi:urate hydroxylase PuuD [Colwellia hornerae]|uniref:Urate hydroxylase PuuD n=1 Tax=Colwellia hornerae TaxID=89402 RepID=A0A5C6QMP9_9GAMM|nr:urate hydroxylase PuuD [Colwellia hornerae]TWX53693.1 urate hydroxylase PuuD [Colwellia hornerae]TWX60343.1 urate hydroxylase PuuD [Colwellia hornerae]TWX70099.1 urate hydroxylase PuuD [Colwellia hornerae]
MDPYIAEWLNLILRFLHLVTGVAWIGASFYFVWLDNHLETPPQWKADKGIKGDLWAIHGGGFYEVAKYQLAPEKMPTTLHWFKWEAYSTWLTGFALLIVMYYVGAESYLIDPRVADISQMQAIIIGLSVIFGSWLAYELMCVTKLANNSVFFALILLIMGAGLAYGLTQVFSARGAFIHVGAVIGTIMAGNVFRGIMPAQRALVAAVESGQAPDPKYAQRAKLRSTFNTYTTLPVLFIMISNHYPITYNHPYNWAVLVAIIVITGAARQYFILRHFGKQKPMILIAAVLATVALAIVIAPKSPNSDASNLAPVDASMAMAIVQQRCTTCHSATPSDDVFTLAPAGVVLDTQAQLKQWAPRIQARVVDSQDMPLLNKTNITDLERAQLAQWIKAGAKINL